MRGSAGGAPSPSAMTKRIASAAFALGVVTTLLAVAWRDSSARTLAPAAAAAAGRGSARMGVGRGGRPPAAAAAAVSSPPPAQPSASASASAAAAGQSSTSAAVARLYTPEGMHPRDAPAALPAAGLAPLTAAAAAILWRSQNPDDCAAAQYLVSLGHVKGNGIGSLMHVTGYHFAVAVEEGRVFQFGEVSGQEWTDPSTCGAARNWECFFRAPSHCGREHLHENRDNWVEMEMHHSSRALHNQDLPGVFRRMLAEAAPDMSEAQLKYWWRAQSVAYLMRLNDATLAAVRQLRTDATLISLAGGPGLTAARAAQLPLPPGAIHAHVRHGDKYTEMQLQGTERYTNASRALVQDQPLALRRVLFVSTEDPDVPAQAADILVPRGWSVLHWTIKRSNRGPLQQVQDLGEASAGLTTRTHLQQMLMSLEADAWVGTRASNWNRLLDELRCTWVDKCSASYIEVGAARAVDEAYDW